MIPQHQERELFTVIVHENQFVVSARRIYELLQPPHAYRQLLQFSIYTGSLKENEDYFYRLPEKGKIKHLLQHVWVTIYGVKTLCTTVEL